MEPKNELEQINGALEQVSERQEQEEKDQELEKLQTIKEGVEEMEDIYHHHIQLLEKVIPSIDQNSISPEQHHRIQEIIGSGNTRAQEMITQAKAKIATLYEKMNKARIGIALGASLVAGMPNMSAQESSTNIQGSQSHEIVSDTSSIENKESTINFEQSQEYEILKRDMLEMLNTQLKEIKQSLLIIENTEEDYVASIQARDTAEKRAYILSEDFQTGESVDLDYMEMFHLRSLENSKNTDLKKFLSTAHAIKIDFENGLAFSEGSFVSEGIGKAYGISFPEIPSMEEAQDAQVREAFISELKEIISQAREADLKQTEYIKNNPDEFIFTNSAEEWAHLRWKSAQENKEKDVQKFNELSSKIKNIETMSPQDFFEYTKRLDTQPQN